MTIDFAETWSETWTFSQKFLNKKILSLLNPFCGGIYFLTNGIYAITQRADAFVKITCYLFSRKCILLRPSLQILSFSKPYHYCDLRRSYAERVNIVLWLWIKQPQTSDLGRDWKDSSLKLHTVC